MRCIICKTEKWFSVDQYRLKAHGMNACDNCGFISYPDLYKKKEDVIAFYRKDYRKTPPTFEHLCQALLKFNFHATFLKDSVFKDWHNRGLKAPRIFEVGAAFGVALSQFKNYVAEDGLRPFPNARLRGSELTETFKRNAYHEFGLRLVDDFDDDEHDLIMSYKVAEHMFDFDLELDRYYKSLPSNGYLYISVPTWFGRLTNFGQGGFDLEYYYHPNHVNVWTRAHFEYLLASAGFKILSQNHSYYDQTYLCVKTEKTAVPLVRNTEVVNNLNRVMKAFECAQASDFSGALKYWPNFPLARRGAYEYGRKAYHARGGFDVIMAELVKPWLSLDPDSHEGYVFAADICMRYDRYQDAINYLSHANIRRPGDESILMAMANCYRMIAKSADDQDRLECLTKARDLSRLIRMQSLRGAAQAVTWVYGDNASLPIPDLTTLQIKD